MQGTALYFCQEFYFYCHNVTLPSLFKDSQFPAIELDRYSNNFKQFTLGFYRKVFR